jgi:hypothetical protein
MNAPRTKPVSEYSDPELQCVWVAFMEHWPKIDGYDLTLDTAIFRDKVTGETKKGPLPGGPLIVHMTQQIKEEVEREFNRRGLDGSWRMTIAHGKVN